MRLIVSDEPQSDAKWFGKFLRSLSLRPTCGSSRTIRRKVRLPSRRVVRISRTPSTALDQARERREEAKLLSGEIRVKQAEKIVVEAV